MSLDPHTFGDSKASVNLASILSKPEYKRYCSRVSKKYHEYCEMMWDICSIKNMSARSYLFNLVIKDNKDIIKNMGLPEPVESHLLNLVIGIYKRNYKMCRDVIVGEKKRLSREQAFKRDGKYYCDNKRHLVCKPYSIDNLHTMADDLGIKRCWFHKHHYDIPKRRIKEIQSKCEMVSSRAIVKLIRGEKRWRKR